MVDDLTPCKCEHCSHEFDANLTALEPGELGSVTCPSCGNQTAVMIPVPVQIVPPMLRVEQPEYSLVIGDIAISGDKVLTPNGNGRLADAQWIFTDATRIERSISPVGVILAIVFALFCLIGLLFLLMKDERMVGYVEVSVHSGSLFHKVQIPARSYKDIERIHGLVSQAQMMSARAKYITV